MKGDINITKQYHIIMGDMHLVILGTSCYPIKENNIFIIELDHELKSIFNAEKISLFYAEDV